MIDEREHRRGLVLGLTLAEILLLLLFLLILALGSRVAENEKIADDFKDKWENERVANGSLRLQVRNLKEANKQLEEAYGLEIETGSLLNDAENSALPKIERDLNQILKDPGQRNSLAKAIAVAAKFDASNPPVILERAAQTLQELTVDESKLAALSSAIQRAAKMDPHDPSALLGTALDKFEKSIVSAAGNNRSVNTNAGAAALSPNAKHNWPPIITLSEADGHFFETGSAALSPSFKTTLSNSVVPRLVKIMKEYDVNVIEVIGHTDEQPISGRPSNLDKNLIPFLKGQIAIDNVVSADNAGLGLARAASVVRLLKSEPRLAHVRLLPYSGAQVIKIDDVMSEGQDSSSIEQRRRIEMRVRRSEKEPVLLPGVVTNSQKKELSQPKERSIKSAPTDPVDWFVTIFGQ